MNTLLSCAPCWNFAYSSICCLLLAKNHPRDEYGYVRIRVTFFPLTRLSYASASSCRCAINSLWLIYYLSLVWRGSHHTLCCLFSVQWHFFIFCTRIPGTDSASRFATLPTVPTPRRRLRHFHRRKTAQISSRTFSHTRASNSIFVFKRTQY